MLVDSRLHHEDMRIYQLGTDIERLATAHISDNLRHIELIQSGLNSRLEFILSTEEQRLSAATHTLNSYSIDNILRLGFAVARTQDEAVKSISQTHIGDEITVELLDGVVGAEIKSVIPKN